MKPKKTTKGLCWYLREHAVKDDDPNLKDKLFADLMDFGRCITIYPPEANKNED